MSWKRTLLAASLLGAAWTWTGARVWAYQTRIGAEAAFWRGSLEESFEGYRRLERFAPAGRKARAGEIEIFLSVTEDSRDRAHRTQLGQRLDDALPGALRGQLLREPLAAETWAGLADVYAVLKPLNQVQRTYSLEEISKPPELGLEIEDLLQIRALEASLALDPNSVYHRDTLADEAWELGLHEMAKRHYGEVITILPDPSKHLFLAPGKVSDELTELVVTSLNRAMEPPRNAPREVVCRHLGMFLLDQGRYQEAFDAFQKAQDVSGNSYADWKAQAQSGMGHLEEAVALYREAMVSGMLPDNRFYVLTGMGDLLQRLGRHREASEAFRSALVIRQHDPGTLIQLGRAYEAMELWEEAEESYLRASEIGANRISNLAQLVQFYQRLGKPSLALEPARKLVELEPSEPVYRTQLKELEKQLERQEH
jgi:tetratricopeptide (TPR) repeat protein